MTIITADTPHSPALRCPECDFQWAYPAAEFTGREVATKVIKCEKCGYGNIVWLFAKTALHPPVKPTPRRRNA